MEEAAVGHILLPLISILHKMCLRVACLAGEAAGPGCIAAVVVGLDCIPSEAVELRMDIAAEEVEFADSRSDTEVEEEHRSLRREAAGLECFDRV